MSTRSYAKLKAYQIIENWKALGLEVKARSHMVKALSVDYARHVISLRVLMAVYCLAAIALACSISIMIWYLRCFAGLRLRDGRSFWQS